MGALRTLRYLVHRRVLRTPFLVAEAPAYGLRFKARTEDVHCRHLYKYGAHERPLTDFLLGQLAFQAGDVVFDVGANIGWYALLLDRMADTGVDLFAFEPDPLNFQLLQENIALNGGRHVTAVNRAVADRTGEQTLYLYQHKNRGRHSLLPLHDGERVQVRTVALDEFVQANGLGERFPRFLKIDVEGYELVALRGASRLLQRCPLVMAEFSPRFLRAGGFDPGDLLDLFGGHGLRPHTVGDGGLRPAERAALLQREANINLIWKR